MATSNFNSQRTSSHKAFEQSLETLKQLSIEQPEQVNTEGTESITSWEAAVDDIEMFLQQTKTSSP